MGDHLTSAIELADAALAARDHDRDRATELAKRALERARRGHDDRAAAVAGRALALVDLDRGRTGAAARRAERALSAARRSGDAATIAGALTTAAGVRFLNGDAQGALAALDETQALAGPVARVDALIQRGWILFRMGRWAEAVAVHEQLLAGDDQRPEDQRPEDQRPEDQRPEDQRPEDQPPEQRASVLRNHGCVLSLLGRYDEALAAFDEAIELLRHRDAEQDLVNVMHNRALCLADSGRLADSFEAFAAVEERLRDEPVDRAWLLVGQADALLHANLAAEALVVARRAVAAAGRRGPAQLRAEAWSRVSRAARRTGASTEARAAARRARAMFEAMGNAAQAAQARHDELTVAPRRTAAVLRELERVVDQLRRAGRVESALLARVEAFELALELGDLTTASRHRHRIAMARPNVTALPRANAWLAEARWANATNDQRRRRAAVAAGLDTLDEHRALLGSTELRAQAAGLGAGLAAIGLDGAMRGGRPAAVLSMVERWRAGTVLRRPVVDGQLAEALAELRQTQEDASGSADARLRLEGRIRRLARAARGGDDAVAEPASVATIRSALGDATLVEIVEHGGGYTAVVVRRSRCQLVELARQADIEASIAELHFALRRLARVGASPAIVAAARAAADDALARLAAGLVVPLGVDGVGQLVVVPPASLHTVPWTSLPGLAGCTDVTVAPSSTWWLHASATTGDPSMATGVTLVAGPRLPGAAAEIAALRPHYPSASVFEPEGAVEAAVLAALDGASLAHLACHAHLRADHPHLSALELTDGPLTVYDLEHLLRAPERVVLSACDSGVSSTRPGDELLGFLTALFSLGARSVVASVVPVPDIATAPLMLALHDHIRAGACLPGALRAARDALDLDDPAAFAAATAFVAFGAA